MQKILFVMIGLVSVNLLASEFSWINSGGGAWNDKSNWLQDGVEATRCPGEGDDVKFKTGVSPKTSYTISLSNDVVVKTFYFFPDLGTTTTTVTTDLNGYRLRATDEINVRSNIDSVRHSILAFTNGYVSCDSAPAGYLQAKGFNVNRESNAFYGTGFLDCLGPVTIGLVGKMTICGNGATARFMNGVTFGDDAGGDLVSSCNRGGMLVLSGQGTTYHSTTYSLTGVAMSTTVVERAASVISCTCGLAGGENAPGAVFIVDDADYTVLQSSAYGTGARIGYNSGALNLSGAKLIVRNEARALIKTSVRVGQSNKSFCLSHDNELHVESGARLECADVTLGTGEGSWGNKLFVDDATLVATNIIAGNTANVVTNSYVGISGRRARIELRQRANQKAFEANYGTTIRFDIPKDGFDRTPVEADNGRMTAADCTEGPVDLRNRIVISGDEFAKAHPMTNVTLMTFGQDSEAAFNELIANFTYVGKERRKGTLLISADKRSLLYRTPSIPGLAIVVR